MDFLIDINPDMKMPEYKLTLCKLNEEPIMTLNNIRDLEVSPQFSGIDELSFTIPLYRYESNGEKVENERYHAVEGDMLLNLNDMQYFYIHYAKESVNESGEVTKEVQAFSREYELSQKIITGYSGVSRKIYTRPGVETDDNGLPIGFLNYVEQVSSWTVGYIHDDIMNKYRELNFNNTNLLKAFQEVQKSFGCIFKFDTIKKIINVHRIEDFESNQGLTITDKNFLKTLEKTIKSDEIKTRLYLYGKDNVSIQSLSITGKPYIENYDFYKNTKYMTQELIDALNNYEEVIQQEEKLFQRYLGLLEEYNPELRQATDLLYEKLSDFKQEEVMLDTIMARPYATDEERNKALREQRKKVKAKEEEMNAQERVKKSWETKIDVVNKDILALRKRIANASTFDKELANELDAFIREDTFSDGNYREDSLDELLAEGHKILNRISQPNIQFDMSVVDFLSLVECQHTWSKFRLGDTVRLKHAELGFDFLVRLISYTHTPDNQSLQLKFSNTGTINDNSLYLRDLIDEMKSTSNDVDFSRYKWDKGENADLQITKYVNNNFDLTKQSLETADGQITLLDHRGYWGTKLNPDGTESPEKLRMTNNLIAMTQDDWETVDIAISPTLGINASLISGKIGNFATINADQILINAETDESPLAQFIRENGGRTYNQPDPPDVTNGVVDKDITIADGALWLKGKDGTVDKVFRYDSTKVYQWPSDMNYIGVCHWEEVTDLALKDKDYGGMKITDDGLKTVQNGVTINKDGLIISNRVDRTRVTTRASADGFKISRENLEVFSVDSDGVLNLRSSPTVYLEMTGEGITMHGGGSQIVINKSGISLPTASSIRIGTKGASDYVSIDGSGVFFGNNGFYYDMRSGDLTIGGTGGLWYRNSDNRLTIGGTDGLNYRGDTLTIGGSNGLKYDGRNLTIGGSSVAEYRDLFAIRRELADLARKVSDGERFRAIVEFG